MTSTTRKVYRAYVPEAVKLTDDVSTDDLNKLQEEFMENISTYLLKNVPILPGIAIQQSQSGLWHSERK